MKFQYDDGGRRAAGFKGETGDCSTRAIAIATGQPYIDVYRALTGMAKVTSARGGRRHGSARTGVSMRVLHKYLSGLGWTWTATMRIGSGCHTHLVEDELPAGRVIVRASKHLAAVIDGVIHDTYNPDRDGTRCVYGYWTNDEVTA